LDVVRALCVLLPKWDLTWRRAGAGDVNRGADTGRLVGHRNLPKQQESWLLCMPAMHHAAMVTVNDRDVDERGDVLVVGG
jgi:hypothetical protein